MAKTISLTSIKDRVVALHRMRAADLKEHPKNWRTHSEYQRGAVSGLLETIGYAGALLAYRTNGDLTLIDGHLRRDLTPEAVVPVLEVDLSDAEAEMLLLTLDPSSALAGRDHKMLEGLRQSTQASIDAGLLAAPSEIVAKLAGLVQRAIPGGLLPGVDPDDLPSAAPPRCQKGEIWRLGPHHRLAVGDAADEGLVRSLFGERRLQLVWTDPPYGVDYAAKNGFLNAIDKGNRNQTPIENDALKLPEVEALITSALTHALRHAVPGAALYMASPSGAALPTFLRAFDASGFTFKHSLVWVKNNFVIGRLDYHYRHETILYGWALTGAHYFIEDHTKHSIFEIDKPQRSKDHPTQKPVALVREMVYNSSRPGDIVYDPFLGSGTTIIACQELGRVAYGCETDAAYASLCVARYEQLTGIAAVKEN